MSETKPEAPKSPTLPTTFSPGDRMLWSSLNERRRTAQAEGRAASAEMALAQLKAQDCEQKLNELQVKYTFGPGSSFDPETGIITRPA